MPRWVETTDLTARQAEVLKAVQQYARKHGHPPNYVELSQLLQIRHSAARRLIQRIAAKGQLEVTPRSPNRSIRLLETGS